MSQSVSQSFWHCHNEEILTVSKTLWHTLWHQKYESLYYSCGSMFWVVGKSTPNIQSLSTLGIETEFPCGVPLTSSLGSSFTSTLAYLCTFHNDYYFFIYINIPIIDNLAPRHRELCAASFVYWQRSGGIKRLIILSPPTRKVSPALLIYRTYGHKKANKSTLLLQHSS